MVPPRCFLMISDEFLLLLLIFSFKLEQNRMRNHIHLKNVANFGQIIELCQFISFELIPS